MCIRFFCAIIFFVTITSYTFALQQNLLDKESDDDFGLSTLSNESFKPNELGPKLEKPEQFFDVVIRINKSIHSPDGQTAFVLYKGQMFRNFKISTGREKWENPKRGNRYFSTTPTGWFHPTVLKPYHYSKRWQAPMWWAVFFNGGIALHGTSTHYYRQLGSRASGGCVRFRKNDAELIYKLIEKTGRGQVPLITRTGQAILNSDGTVKYHEGWKTLIIVEGD